MAQAEFPPWLRVGVLEKRTKRHLAPELGLTFKGELAKHRLGALDSNISEDESPGLCVL